MNRIYFIPPGANFEPECPTSDDLNNGVDITDYTTTDGLQIDSEYEAAIEAFQTAFRHTVEVTANDLREIAEALGARPFPQPRTARRAMNTNMKYPTSTPPWKRGKR